MFITFIHLNFTVRRKRVPGALFDYHPELQPVASDGVYLLVCMDLRCDQTFVTVDKSHPSTSMLPDRWTFTEEAYNFRSDPRLVGAKVVLSVDETSYTGQHAIASLRAPD